MKTKLKFLVVFCYLLLFSCASEQIIEEYNINPILKSKVSLVYKSNDVVKLQLCKEVPFKWDNIIVLPPYTTVEVVKKLNLSNSVEIEKKFPELMLNEGRCMLLFLEKNKILTYSFVPRNLIDFNMLVGTNKTSFKISKDMGCKQLYIKRESNVLSLEF